MSRSRGLIGAIGLLPPYGFARIFMRSRRSRKVNLFDRNYPVMPRAPGADDARRPSAGARGPRRMPRWQRFLIIDVKCGPRDIPSVRACRFLAVRWVAEPGWGPVPSCP